MGVNFDRDIHCVLGLPFDAVNMADTVRQVRDAATRRAPCFISTANVNFLVSARRDSQFRDSIVNSDLSVADGMPLIWIARLLDVPLRDRVTGANLFETLRRGPGAPLSVYFFGGPDGVAAAACRTLTLENGGLACAGYASPGFGSIDALSAEPIIERINASNADLLAVSLGAMKGQDWIERNRHRLNVPIVSHLGAVLHFTAGVVRRAPAWMQSLGLEWLWRIKEQPALWRRYLGDGLALLGLLAVRVVPHVLHLRRYKAPSVPAAAVETTAEGQWHVLRLRGVWTRRNIDPLRDCFSAAAQAGKHVKLDMGGVSWVDSAFLGLAILLWGHQQRRRKQFVMAQIRPTVRQLIKYSCADYLCSDASYAGSEPAVDEVLDVSESARSGIS